MFGQNRQPASEAYFLEKELIIKTTSDLTGMFLMCCLCCCNCSKNTVVYVNLRLNVINQSENCFSRYLHVFCV